MKKIITAQNKEHLKALIQEEIELNGNQCDLNHIDTSIINNMSNMFANSEFNGDISQWNVSKVKDMRFMFFSSQFNKKISDWNVKNVINMNTMFYESEFNGDISRWNVENVTNMQYMFNECNIEKPWWGIEDNDKRKEAIENYNLMQKLDKKLISKEKIIPPKKMKI